MATKKVLISISDEFIKAIDEYCQQYGFDERSEFIRQTLREKIFGYRVYKKQEENISTPVPENYESIKSQPIISQIRDIGGAREQIWTNRNGEPIFVGIKSEDYCQSHFEKGRKFKLYHLVYEDENGVRSIDKWMCEDCKYDLIKRANEVGTLIST